MFAKLLVRFYVLWHGRLHLPGAGWLLRSAARFGCGLRSYPLDVPNVGTAVIDFRDIAAFGLLNVSLGDLGHDLHQINLIQRCLQRGAVVWDVGANVGYFSLSLLRRCPDLGALHAFEPNPGALRTLRSLFQNQPKVTVHPVGLGQTNQELELSAHPSGSQVGSLVRPIAGADRIKISVRRGDDYARQYALPDPDLLKVDVEGFEAEVFAGLSELIARKQPVIFFEHHFLSDDQIREVVPAGYTLHFIFDDGQLSSQFDRRNSSDCVLLPPGRQNLFDA